MAVRVAPLSRVAPPHRPADPGPAQPPWRVRGSPAGDLLAGAVLAAVWLALWVFFALAVAAPAARWMAAVARASPAAVAAAGGAGGPAR
jgi:hypothetical protein